MVIIIASAPPIHRSSSHLHVCVPSSIDRWYHIFFTRITTPPHQKAINEDQRTARTISGTCGNYFIHPLRTYYSSTGNVDWCAQNQINAVCAVPYRHHAHAKLHARGRIEQEANRKYYYCILHILRLVRNQYHYYS